MRASVFVIAGAVASALLAGCGANTGSAYGGSSSPASAPAPASSTAPASAETTVMLGSSSLGQFLVDGQGRTLYLFEGDKNGTSACASACATFWPPLAGKATAGTGVSTANLATITRADGTTQVTYFGHPLYYFSKDIVAGDTKGEAVLAYGSDWYVVAATGNKIDKS
jgi:predicted lipoprotein with Yx(FWY)xxD motif